MGIVDKLNSWFDMVFWDIAASQNEEIEALKQKFKSFWNPLVKKIKWSWINSTFAFENYKIIDKDRNVLILRKRNNFFSLLFSFFVFFGLSLYFYVNNFKGKDLSYESFWLPKEIFLTFISLIVLFFLVKFCSIFIMLNKSKEKIFVKLDKKIDFINYYNKNVQTILFNDSVALQLINVSVKENGWYIKLYQINLIMRDWTRENLQTCKSLNEAQVQVKILSDFIDIPIWEVTGTKRISNYSKILSEI